MKQVFSMVLILSLSTAMKLHAQDDCTFKPFLTIDFGAGKDIPDLNYFSLEKYGRVFDTCPNDGYYSYVSSTGDCFNGDWLTFTEDHTLGDVDGRMLVVNASETGGVFFNFAIKNLKENTTYQLATWLVNVCRISGGCAPLPPNIIIKIFTTSGKVIAQFTTGLLSQTAIPFWKKYEGMFTTPAGVNAVLLTMEDATLGSCGNDFAMDDLSLQECVKPVPVVINTPKPEVKKITQPDKKEVIKTPIVIKPQTKKITVEKKDTVAIPKRTVPDKLQNIPTQIKEIPVTAIPKPILTRENPVIKKIETAAGEMVINLYDNGEIDGDTVTIYHNNKLLVSRAGLSEKAITFKIQVDAAHPHHELVMVAENLGSIPPNTSLMVVTANNKRYEIFISSSETKNAKIVIDLEK